MEFYRHDKIQVAAHKIKERRGIKGRSNVTGNTFMGISNARAPAHTPTPRFQCRCIPLTGSCSIAIGHLHSFFGCAVQVEMASKAIQGQEGALFYIKRSSQLDRLERKLLPPKLLPPPPEGVVDWGEAEGEGRMLHDLPALLTHKPGGGRGRGGK